MPWFRHTVPGRTSLLSFHPDQLGKNIYFGLRKAILYSSRIDQSRSGTEVFPKIINLNFSVHLGKLASIFQVEIHAINVCVRANLNLNIRDRKVIVYAGIQPDHNVLN